MNFQKLILLAILTASFCLTFSVYSQTHDRYDQNNPVSIEEVDVNAKRGPYARLNSLYYYGTGNCSEP